MREIGRSVGEGWGYGIPFPKRWRVRAGDRGDASSMMRFLQPEWFWALTLLPLIVLWRGRRGPVAAVEYSDVSLARDVARRTRRRIGGVVWLLPIIAAALLILRLPPPHPTPTRTATPSIRID